jgi:hypothetical protein
MAAAIPRQTEAEDDTVWLAQSGCDLSLCDEYLVKVEDANGLHVRPITRPCHQAR